MSILPSTERPKVNKKEQSSQKKKKPIKEFDIEDMEVDKAKPVV